MIGLISYLVFFTTVAAILSIAVLGLNLQWGNSGLFNGGVVAFFGAGAYTTLILGGTPQEAHLGGYQLFYPLALAGGMVAAGVMAWVVGILTLRLRHDYLAIATFGVAVAFENLMRNAEWLAGGAQGLRGFERPLHAWLGDGFTYNALFLIFVLLLLVGTYLFLQRLICMSCRGGLRQVMSRPSSLSAGCMRPARMPMSISTSRSSGTSWPSPRGCVKPS